MNAQVILLPRDLTPPSVAGRTVVVLDVLRATTTMTAALAANVAAIRVFDNIDAAATAAAAFDGPKVLCGEVNCLPPAGFDLGNSPRQWNPANCAGRTAFMTTTNGTRAIAAAAALGAAKMLVGALANASAVAENAAAMGRDITLLCAGSDGEVSLEDLLGSGALLDQLVKCGFSCDGDAAQIAALAFQHGRGNLPGLMRLGNGGRKLAGVGLEADIDACAAIDSMSAVGVIDVDSLTVKALTPLRG